jgi:hypothetical protein
VTTTLFEWLNGRNPEKREWYDLELCDFDETRPAWRTRWFWIGVLIFCFVLALVFLVR